MKIIVTFSGISYMVEIYEPMLFPDSEHGTVPAPEKNGCLGFTVERVRDGEKIEDESRRCVDILVRPELTCWSNRPCKI